MIDVSRILQIFGLYCSSFRPFLLFLGACLALFASFSILKMIMRSKKYV